jgi:hypothetical protein
MTPQWASSRPFELSPYGKGAAASPKDLEDWRKYVRKVAERYKGRIKYYEIWNEPNDKSFFTDNTSKMVALTRIAYEELKSVDSQNRVISPAATGGSLNVKWLDEFLKLGGGKYVDIIAFHLYVPEGKPEDFLEIVNKIKSLMIYYHIKDKEIWNTETGWRIDNELGDPDSFGSNYSKWKKLNESEASAYIARSHILAWAAGVDRFYWYSWDNNYLGLIEPLTNESKRGLVDSYSRTIKWLEGSTLSGCKNSYNFWTCYLNDSKGRKEWVVWTDKKNSIHWEIPNDWHVVEMESLDGEIRNFDLNSNRSLDVNESPIMLRSMHTNS